MSVSMNITRAQIALAKLFGAGANVFLVGDPGVGKTYILKQIARLLGMLRTMNCGKAAAWATISPYDDITGETRQGLLAEADGYVVQHRRLQHQRPDGYRCGVLVMDEVNRTDPQNSGSENSALASGEVEFMGEVYPTTVRLAATANPTDRGTEVLPWALLDRFHAFLRLEPSEDETVKIAARTMPGADRAAVLAAYEQAFATPAITEEAARVITEHTRKLSTALGTGRYYRPIGVRMVDSIGKLLRAGCWGPAECFRSASERCWPVGVSGIDKHRGAFDAAVNGVAASFATRMAQLPGFTVKSAVVPVVTPLVATLEDLVTMMESCHQEAVTSPALNLPRRWQELMGALQEVFGFGLVKELLTAYRRGRDEGGKNGVRISFGRQAKPDAVSFQKAAAGDVERFLRMVLGK